MRPGLVAVAAATALAGALTAHTAWNVRHLRRAPRPAPGDPAESMRIAVLLPARDEAARIGPCLVALLAQGHPQMRVVVLDDGSTDGTYEVVAGYLRADPRFALLAGGDRPPPPGWLGKPWACQRLADAAMTHPALTDPGLAHSDLADPGLADPGFTGAWAPDLFVFLDADVVLAPDALTRIAALMHDSGLDLASPYPRQQVGTRAERLVQPLLQWSWLTTLPLTVAESSARPSLTAANGQILVIRPEAHQRIGGHGAVRHEVLEDIALARAVKAAGGRANVTDGTDLATCRMYTTGPELVDGYTKSLWAAFGSPVGSAGATSLLTFAYVLPPAAALLAHSPTIRALGAAGYAA
ncbi:MAG: glycosyltransferase, partial [Candidatus Nanopelagicales bacterium]